MEDSGERTVIGPNTYVGHYAIVGSGSKLSSQVIVEDYCAIESEVTVGEKTLITYRAQVCNEAKVGKACIVAGFVAEGVTIGDKVRLFGKLVHSQHNPTLGWDSVEAVEDSPVVKSGAFIGFDSMVIGNVVVGPRAYVCAGAIVTKDVPASHVAYGVNRIIPFNQWKGPLAKSPHFLGQETR